MPPWAWAAEIAGSLMQAAPLAAAWPARGRLTPARRWAAAWSGFAVAALALQVITSRRGPNLWLNYWLEPLDAALALWTLSCLLDAGPRRLVRWTIPVAILAHVTAAATVENRHGWSLFGIPLLALLAFGAAILTLVRRASAETEPVQRCDWFWIGGGFAVYFAALATFDPLSAALLLQGAMGPYVRALAVFQLANLVGYAAVAVGVLCPIPPERCGASSSPSSSPSGSPSSPSASP